VLFALGGYRGTVWAADSAADTAIYEPVAAAAAVSPTAAGSASEPDNTLAPVASAPAVSHPDSPSTPRVTTEVIVPSSMPAPSYVKEGADLPPSTTEIPQAPEAPQPSTADGAPEPSTAEIDNAADAQAIYYQAHQNPQMIDPQLHSLQEFINEGDESSPLGVELREERRKLNSGEIADGLTIVDVRNGSAADKGGLHPCRHIARNVLQGVALAAALFFPPAVLAVPILEQVGVGETYDMIIGVDGTRVVNFLDFEDRMRDVQPGEIVYLSIVRNGDRMQVPLHVGSWPP